MNESYLRNIFGLVNIEGKIEEKCIQITIGEWQCSHTALQFKNKYVFGILLSHSERGNLGEYKRGFRSFLT